MPWVRYAVWGGLGGLVALSDLAHAEESPRRPAEYVGHSVCAGCHPAQRQRWQGSHHDLAMQEATAATVLGDFDAATFTHFGLTTRFYRTNGQFKVRTEGADGALRDYPVRYTFGAYPLQQYLIAFPGRRYQALDIAWDSRPKAAGGQRWFSLHPSERIAPGDPLHWTGLYQNWNSSCAECHSTNLHKNYDPQRGRFATTWTDIDVACEACHGPGSRHVAWARGAAGEGEDDKGLAVRFTKRIGVGWPIDPHSGNARRSRPRTGSVEIDACGRCHARRSPLTEHALPAAKTPTPNGA